MEEGGGKKSEREGRVGERAPKKFISWRKVAEKFIRWPKFREKNLLGEFHDLLVGGQKPKIY